MTDDERKALREKALAATPGPWEWYGNTKSYDVYLATTHSGRRFVMDFVRWGMGAAAQPRFQVTIDGDASGGGVMRSLKALADGDENAKTKALDLPQLGPKFEVDYRRQFVGIGHPDAAFIAAANPAAVIALLDDNDQLRAEVERLDAALGEEIDERDARLKQIDDIADALGDEGEWSNLHDRGQAAYELASSAVAEVESLRAETTRLCGLLAIERATVEQVMMTQRSERDYDRQQLSTLTAERDTALAAKDEACELADSALTNLSDVTEAYDDGMRSNIYHAVMRISELRAIGRTKEPK